MHKKINMSFEKKIKKLEKNKSIVIYRNENLRNYLSFRPLNLTAKGVIIINTLPALKTILKYKNSEKFCFLGNGTNVIFKDDFYDGYVLKLGAGFKKIKVIKSLKNFVYVKVGAGVNMYVLNNFLKNNGFSGLEFSYGIPGSFGGGIIMNCGAFGHEICEAISSVQILEKNSVWAKDFWFKYRNSSFKEKNQIVLGGILKLEKSSAKNVESKMNEILAKRHASQPTLASVGSVFKRVIDEEKIIFPAKLIDNLSLKGVKIGDAEVSKIHSGFIVNNGNATCKDFLNLVNFLQDKVFKEYNILLEPEFEVIK